VRPVVDEPLVEAGHLFDMLVDDADVVRHE
jgi:hypothetical protein